MNDENNINSTEVTAGSDGVYRWMYVMNMEENKSMLYLLLKIFGWISAGACVMWFGMLAVMDVLGRTDILKTLCIWILITVAVEGLVYLGYTISRGVMKNSYPLRFEMNETGISLYQSEENMRRRKEGYYGRKPFRDTVSETTFSSVLSIKTYPQWDLIDMAVIGGGFQVYVRPEDYDLVLKYILERAPKRVREAAGNRI